jgi:cytochrome c oxidase assembly protein subunit 11
MNERGEMEQADTDKKAQKANQRVAISASFMAVAMIGVSFAAVPLYDMFCRVTGFGGTTQVAETAPGAVSDRVMTVRFDASLNRKMPWRFEAPEAAINIPVGESGLAFYRAKNPTDRMITGTATYNVSPPEAGIYFSKIDCFCFTEQVLQPGEAVDMPVSFFIDPEILTDSEMDDVKTITLSYTFFEAAQQASAEVGTSRITGQNVRSEGMN